VSQVWSWALAAIGIAGLWIAAHRPRLGFALNIAAQPLWATYSIVTRQWGFLITAAAYAAVYIRLWRRANRTERSTP
jgi:hypothetical protein